MRKVFNWFYGGGAREGLIFEGAALDNRNTFKLNLCHNLHPSQDSFPYIKD